MRPILLTLLLLFTISACTDNETQAKHDAKMAQEVQQHKRLQAEKNSLLAELKAKDMALEKVREEALVAQAALLAQEKVKKEAFIEEQRQKKRTEKQAVQNEKLSNIGINIDQNKITIDTDKTKDFFQKLTQGFEDKIRKITQDIERGVIDHKDAGVKIDENHIDIDLNKTKDFLELWGKKMQSFVKEFDTMAKEIDSSTK